MTSITPPLDKPPTIKRVRIQLSPANPEMNLWRNIMIQGIAEKLAAQSNKKREVS